MGGVVVPPMDGKPGGCGNFPRARAGGAASCARNGLKFSTRHTEQQTGKRATPRQPDRANRRQVSASRERARTVYRIDPDRDTVGVCRLRAAAGVGASSPRTCHGLTVPTTRKAATTGSKHRRQRRRILRRRICRQPAAKPAPTKKHPAANRVRRKEIYQAESMEQGRALTLQIA